MFLEICMQSYSVVFALRQQNSKQNYAKSVNFLCTGDTDFAKYQAQGGGLIPTPPLAYALGFKVYLAKVNNLPKHHGAGPPEARDPMQLHRLRWLNLLFLRFSGYFRFFYLVWTSTTFRDSLSFLHFFLSLASGSLYGRGKKIKKSFIKLM